MMTVLYVEGQITFICPRMAGAIPIPSLGAHNLAHAARLVVGEMS